MEVQERPPPQSPAVSFREALGFWLKLGLISFGGPAGQIAIMHRELVERRRWISEKRFLHALNYCMVLPGPEAQQLATYVGWLLHGICGGLVAGGLFVLPSLGILIVLSALYMYWGNVPVVAAALAGVKPAVVAIVVSALFRIGKRSLRRWPMVCLAVFAFVSLAFFHVPFPLIVLVAAVCGWAGSRLWPELFNESPPSHSSQRSASDESPCVIGDHSPLPDHARFNWRRQIRIGLVGLVLWVIPIAVLILWQGMSGTFSRMGLFFTVAALVTFGGAYAVLPYVAFQTVEVFGWLRREQMIDGLALGETTPGPLIIIVAFVGFVAGFQASGLGITGAILGSIIATYFTFLPSFLFIFLGAPLIERSRGEFHLGSAMNAISAAVVGVILNLALTFATTTFWPGENGFSWGDPIQTIRSADWLAIVIAIVAACALIKYKATVVHVIVAAVAVGLSYFFFFGAT